MLRVRRGSFVLAGFLLCCLPFLSFAQTDGKDSRAVLFYNVENLFDIYNDSLINDDDFTPDGALHWTSRRYYQKINSITKVILDANGWNCPFIIGLCEIENQKVLNDLLFVGGLKNLHYKIVHYDSPDARGIDVALLYNSHIFKVIESYPIPVCSEDLNLKSRDILYVKGVADNNDTLHLFVNHFPSRRGGVEASVSRRLWASQQLRFHVDSILSHEKEAKILAMGDFNDTPADSSILALLGNPKITTNPLIPLAKPLYESGIGSHKFDGEWSLIDQMFITKSYLDGIEPDALESVNGFTTVKLPYLTIEDETNFGVKPSRTYQGPRYLGGYSDHLPVVFRYLRK